MNGCREPMQRQIDHLVESDVAHLIPASRGGAVLVDLRETLKLLKERFQATGLDGISRLGGFVAAVVGENPADILVDVVIWDSLTAKVRDFPITDHAFTGQHIGRDIGIYPEELKPHLAPVAALIFGHSEFSQRHVGRVVNPDGEPAVADCAQIVGHGQFNPAEGRRSGEAN